MPLGRGGASAAHLFEEAARCCCSGCKQAGVVEVLLRSLELRNSKSEKSAKNQELFLIGKGECRTKNGFLFRTRERHRHISVSRGGGRPCFWMTVPRRPRVAMRISHRVPGEEGEGGGSALPKEMQHDPSKNWLYLALFVVITKHRGMLNVSTASVIQSASQRRRLNREPHHQFHFSTIALAAAAAVAAFNFSDYNSSNESESDEEDAEMHHPGELEPDEEKFADHDDDRHGDRYGAWCKRHYLDQYVWNCCGGAGDKRGCVSTLRAAREAAKNEANELMQLAIDQLTSSNIASRLTCMSEQLDCLNDIGIFPSLSEEQLAAKKQLETNLVEACLAVEAQVPTDALAAAQYMAPMSTALNILSGLPLSEEQQAKKKELETAAAALVAACLAEGGRRQRE
jgi:hypothetical protein